MAIKTAEKRGEIEGRAKDRVGERIEIAKKLLDILDNETISLKTRLSLEEVGKPRK